MGSKGKKEKKEKRREEIRHIYLCANPLCRQLFTEPHPSNFCSATCIVQAGLMGWRCEGAR